MEALAITPANRLIEYRKPLRVFVKNSIERRSAKKQKQSYPRILMPEQPSGYIKPKAHTIW
jgi:hypothetical protein